jgi:DNA polymerase-3 subunit beta
MEFKIQKELLLKKLQTASKFCLSKTSAIPTLQGGLIVIENNHLSITTTDLNDFFNTSLLIETENKERKSFVLDIKKIVEFLQFLSASHIQIEITDKAFIIKNEKTVATFDIMSSSDFPSLPQTEGTSVPIKKHFLEKSLPLLLFSVSHDESRPILTGLAFIKKEDKSYMVTTDGFRLSLLEGTGIGNENAISISAHILNEVMSLEADGEMIISENSKTVSFIVKEDRIVTRLIEGSFPPFERVIPNSYTTKVVLDREELLKNIKLSSVFARDFSSIIVFDIKSDGIYIKPKVKEEKGTVIYQEGLVEGKEQNISFNFRFVLDFLNNVKTKNIVFELNSSNSPGVFRIEENKNYLHIIMPVRAD